MMWPLYEQTGAAPPQQDVVERSQQTLDKQTAIGKLKRNAVRQKRRRINL
jgi:hypothetical protein